MGKLVETRPAGAPDDVVAGRDVDAATADVEALDAADLMLADWAAAEDWAAATAAADTAAPDPEPVVPLVPLLFVVPAPLLVVPVVPDVPLEPLLFVVPVPELVVPLPELVVPVVPVVPLLDPEELPLPELVVPLVPELPPLVDPVVPLVVPELTGAPVLAPLHVPTAFAFWVRLMELTAEFVGAHCVTNTGERALGDDCHNGMESHLGRQGAGRYEVTQSSTGPARDQARTILQGHGVSLKEARGRRREERTESVSK